MWRMSATSACNSQNIYTEYTNSRNEEFTQHVQAHRSKAPELHSTCTLIPRQHVNTEKRHAREMKDLPWNTFFKVLVDVSPSNGPNVLELDSGSNFRSLQMFTARGNNFSYRFTEIVTPKSKPDWVGSIPSLSAVSTSKQYKIKRLWPNSKECTTNFSWLLYPVKLATAKCQIDCIGAPAA